MRRASLAVAATVLAAATAGCRGGLAADVEWGPEKDGIATRLVPLQDEYVIGGPMRFRLELKNETSTPMHFDKQGLRERCLVVTGPDGERAPYIGPSYCTMAFYRFAEPGETVTLRTIDARPYFFVDTPGRYAVSYDLQGFRVSDEDRGIHWNWRPHKKADEHEPWTVSGLATNTLDIDVLPGELAPWQVAIGRLLEVLRGRWTVSGVSGGEELTPEERELSIRAEICLNAHVSHHGVGITVWETERRVDPASLCQAWRRITNEYWGENERGHVYVRIPPSQEYIWPDARERIAAALDVADTAPPTPERVVNMRDLRNALLAGDATKVAAIVEAHAEIIDADLGRGRKDKATLTGSALLWTAQVGDAALVKILLDRGADIDARTSRGHSPLHYAVSPKRKELFALLLERGADVNAKTKDGTTPLHAAAGGGHAEIVETLLDHGARVNEKAEGYHDRTPLHAAAGGGHLGVVKLLLVRGADVDPEGKGRSPFHCAASSGNAQMAQLLLDHGADIEAVHAGNGWTPLGSAAYSGKRETVELLLARGARIDHRDKKGRTPLYLAAALGRNGEDRKEVVTLLLARGASVDVVDENGSTLLHRAVRPGRRGIVEALLARGAEVNTHTTKGWTPLHTAAVYNCREIVPLLLEHGADVNAKNADGETPLDVAERKDHKGIAGLLRR